MCKLGDFTTIIDDSDYSNECASQQSCISCVEPAAELGITVTHFPGMFGLEVRAQIATVPPVNQEECCTG